MFVTVLTETALIENAYIEVYLYFEQAVAYILQGVVLQLRGWVGFNNISP
jgi:hypothetical protein